MKWLNEHSRMFLERGYLTEGVTPEERVRSVQHLDFLSDHEKEVFKTFSEINQMEIINQAATRQLFIDQSQSLNVMINPETSAREINQLYIHAWENGIKSLYYQHSTNAAQQFSQQKLCATCEA